jgi:hypothetical protein
MGAWGNLLLKKKKKEFEKESRRKESPQLNVVM